MRIIAGEFRSRRLQAPPGGGTRPTSDRLREALFSVLSSRLGGSFAQTRFLDLYAGSGANGLEALSRGAAEAVLVEQGAPALLALRANIAALRVEARVRVEPGAVGRWLQRASPGREGQFAVIFMDPPYTEAGEYAATLGSLGGSAIGLLAPGGIVIAEHRRASAGKTFFAPAEQHGALRRTRILEQGDAALSFFNRSPEPGEL